MLCSQFGLFMQTLGCVDAHPPLCVMTSRCHNNHLSGAVRKCLRAWQPYCVTAVECYQISTHSRHRQLDAWLGAKRRQNRTIIALLEPASNELYVAPIVGALLQVIVEVLLIMNTELWWYCDSVIFLCNQWQTIIICVTSTRCLFRSNPTVCSMTAFRIYW